MGAAIQTTALLLNFGFQIRSFLLNLLSPSISPFLPPAFYLTASFVFQGVPLPLASGSLLLAPRVNPLFIPSSCSFARSSTSMARMPRLRVDANAPATNFPSQDHPVYPRKGSRHESVYRYGDRCCLEIQSHSIHKYFKVDAA